MCPHDMYVPDRLLPKNFVSALYSDVMNIQTGFFLSFQENVGSIPTLSLQRGKASLGTLVHRTCTERARSFLSHDAFFAGACSHSKSLQTLD